MGNIVNRVFDSSGPEGKVRGTPQQIIEKYNQLARDASLGNDRVAFENFQQHAEHYTRLLGEAMREQEARREQQEREQQERRQNNNQNNDRGGQDNDQRNHGQGNDQRGQHRDPGSEEQPRVAEAVPDQVIDIQDDSDDSGLVETPESKPKRQRRPRKPKPEQASESGGETQDAAPETDAPEAAE
jgi:hypothetical protein